MKWEGFQYTTSLDLNTGYYHVRLTEYASILCAIILPWGKYCYRCLPTEVSNSPDILQQKMNYLFQGFEFICAYIYEILILKKVDWIDHVQKLKLV